MRVLTLYKPGRESAGPQSPEHLAEMMKFIGEMAASGHLLQTDGLQPSAKGARVRIGQDGKFTVTDGPFAEAKELVGGFAILKVKDMPEAIALTKRFLAVMKEGESEIRLMPDEPAYPRP